MAEKRWMAILCVALVAALPACGDDDPDGGKAATLTEESTTTTTTEAPADDPTLGGPLESEEEAPAQALDQAALDAKLLTVGDFPPGWSVTPPEDDGDDEGDDEFCEEAFRDFEALEDDDGPSAEAEFQKGEPSLMGGAFLAQTISSGDEAELADAFDRLPAAFDQCREFEETDDEGSTTKGTISPLSFEKFGDDTFAMHMSATISSEGFEMPMGGDFVFVRKGNVVMMIGSIGFGMGAVPPDELLQITRSGFEKL